MPTTFISDRGFLQSTATTPTVIYLNALQNSTVVLDFSFTPLTIPTVPLVLTVRRGGASYHHTPVVDDSGVYWFRGILVPSLCTVNAYGNRFAWQYSGYSETGALPVGMNSMTDMVIGDEQLSNRPLGSTQIISYASPSWGSVMDIFVGPIPGTSTIDKRITLKLEYGVGATSVVQNILDELPISGNMMFRKVAIPTRCSVTAYMWGNVAVMCQWAWQRVQPNVGI